MNKEELIELLRNVIDHALHFQAMNSGKLKYEKTDMFLAHYIISDLERSNPVLLKRLLELKND